MVHRMFRMFLFGLSLFYFLLALAAVGLMLLNMFFDLPFQWTRGIFELPARRREVLSSVGIALLVGFGVLVLLTILQRAGTRSSRRPGTYASYNRMGEYGFAGFVSKALLVNALFGFVLAAANISSKMVKPILYTVVSLLAIIPWAILRANFYSYSDESLSRQVRRIVTREGDILYRRPVKPLPRKASKAMKLPLPVTVLLVVLIVLFARNFIADFAGMGAVGVVFLSIFGAAAGLGIWSLYGKHRDLAGFRKGLKGHDVILEKKGRSQVVGQLRPAGSRNRGRTREALQKGRRNVICVPSGEDMTGQTSKNRQANI